MCFDAARHMRGRGEERLWGEQHGISLVKEVLSPREVLEGVHHPEDACGGVPLLRPAVQLLASPDGSPHAKSDNPHPSHCASRLQQKHPRTGRAGAGRSGGERGRGMRA